MGLFDFLKPKQVDTSNFVTLEQYNTLRSQVLQLTELMPDHVDTSKFLTEDDLPDLTVYAKKDDVPSITGLATVKQIPTMPDMSKYALKTDISKVDLTGYALKTDIPDTVKFIENSNTKSTIKKIRISIEDKATFDPKTNPADNIAHTI
jgi:hypothetical protein